jgi:hypothetical protein
MPALIEAGADEPRSTKPPSTACWPSMPPRHRASSGFDGSTWPLLTYDDLALKTAHDIFVEWQPKFRDLRLR